MYFLRVLQSLLKIVFFFPCVRSALPSHNYNLRPRLHPLELPVSDSRNFLPCLMYQDIYKPCPLKFVCPSYSSTSYQYSCRPTYKTLKC